MKSNGENSLWQSGDLLFNPVLDASLSDPKRRRKWRKPPYLEDSEERAELLRTIHHLVHPSIHLSIHHPSIFPLIYHLSFIHLSIHPLTHTISSHILGWVAASPVVPWSYSEVTETSQLTCLQGKLPPRHTQIVTVPWEDTVAITDILLHETMAYPVNSSLPKSGSRTLVCQELG